jgi:GNAT superfamily N-acetyltransferase
VSGTGAGAARVGVEWAEAEGWNPGLDDDRRFLAADGGAFLATFRGGLVAATASCALYGDGYAFIGFFIVRPDLRRRGLGSALFTRALGRANGRVVGLDAVLDQVPFYARRGFVASHRNVRWRMAGGGSCPSGLVELGSVPFAEVLGFDAAVFGAERERFLRAWLDRPPEQALAYVADGRLAGYGLLRQCRVGAKVGPLFADDVEVAGALLAGLAAAAPEGTDVFVDMPAANPRVRVLQASRAMEPAFETVRMYLNGRPAEDVRRVFGVTTLEFG